MKSDNLLRCMAVVAVMWLPFTSNGAVDCNVYVRGDINGWGVSENYKFKPTSDEDILYLTLPRMSGEFKIADENWDKMDFGGAPFVTDRLMTVGLGVYNCVRKGLNFSAESMTDVALVLDCHSIYSPLLTVMPVSEFRVADYACPEMSEYYLRGELHGYNWKCVPEYRFEKTAELEVYRLSIDELYGNFRIGDEEQTTDFGAARVTLGEWTPLKANGADISCGHLDGALLELDMSDKTSPRLRITGSVHEDDMEPSGIYLMSNMSDSEFKANPRYEFRHRAGSAVHTLKVSTLYDGFKLGSPDYGTVDLGNVSPGGGWMKIDGCGSYPLKSSGDCFYTNPMIDVEFTLNLTDASSPWLTIAKDNKADTRWREGFTLRFAEEFNGTGLDENRWTPYDGDASWWGALHTFTPRDENVRVADGALYLTARRENYGGRSFTSGGVISFQKFAYRYGRLDIRMKQPRTNNGLCVALWLVGYHYRWPSSGEIDIIEHGHANDIIAGDTPVHFFAGTPAGPFDKAEARVFGWDTHAPYSVQDGEYHLYTMFWDKDRLLFFLDYDKHPDAEPYYAQIIRREHPEDPYHAGNYFHHPYFLIFHIGVQQTAPETIVVNPEDVTALNDGNGQQASMLIDYARIYQKGNPEDIFESLGDGDEVTSLVNEEFSGRDDADDGNSCYYDLLGRPVSPDAKGLVICKRGIRVTKSVRR